MSKDGACFWTNGQHVTFYLGVLPAMTKPYGLSADVFSFAVLWEIVTSRIPSKLKYQPLRKHTAS
jgi:hypothetical protein